MSMKIGYLGAGTWGFCLAVLLASKGNELVVWTREADLAQRLASGGDHPNLPGFRLTEGMRITTDIGEALKGAEMVVEGVTSAGIRPVFSQLDKMGYNGCPIVLTSKGIEQDSGLLLTDVALEVLGERRREVIGCLSGPSHAEEVIRGLPTSVVCSAYDEGVMHFIQDTFATATFRVYPNSDINGVEFGGAMKNIVAIACGLSDGLGFGDNTKAALMTRGLHEIRKLGVVKGCRAETLNGLAGMGDLCVTCLSNFSRNYRFGRLLANGLPVAQAQKEIGMVVEGAYTCKSALQLGKKYGVPLPITEVVYRIIYEEMNPMEAVRSLLSRTIKEEHL
ncbi:MAG: NAD(P)H-dependent glycerol-3-phosphate dehydrogenase [Parachlamydiales bacterium]